MSKFLLFVFLALFGAVAYGNTQLRFVNAWYATGVGIGLAADLSDAANTTLGNGKIAVIDPLPSGTVIPATDYLNIPLYSFVVGKTVRLSAFSLDDTNVPLNELAGIDTTLQEDQSYSAVYVDATSEDIGASSTVSFSPASVFVFEEVPPAPIPYGKALVRVVNVAVSTWQSNNMTVTINGSGVQAQDVNIPFGEASDFLVYNAAGSLTLDFTLPVDDNADGFARSVSITTVIDNTVVVYIRGDIGNICRKGTSQTTVPFPPAPPVAAPVAPPTGTPMAADPAAEPMTDTPSAPVASTIPTTSRTPTKRVSSAAQTVAQIAGIVALASMLL